MFLQRLAPCFMYMKVSHCWCMQSIKQYVPSVARTADCDTCVYSEMLWIKGSQAWPEHASLTLLDTGRLLNTSYVAVTTAARANLRLAVHCLLAVLCLLLQLWEELGLWLHIPPGGILLLEVEGL